MNAKTNAKPPEMRADQAPPADASEAVTELGGVELNDRKRPRIGEIRAAEAAFLDLIAFLGPNGNPIRELDLSKTKVEEAAMWASRVWSRSKGFAPVCSGGIMSNLYRSGISASASFLRQHSTPFRAVAATHSQGKSTARTPSTKA
ncbi:hypothetical protein [Bradyrhizobium sp. 30]|uniref:Acb2/Tad1 domain-containing protein n=1 Tax=Bradyrhizobium sp. 30 TaxID=2782669 RepID=UPI001FF70F29|nr:hypothetical protein [Bradyrhizobium sp. 30]MCK1295251.1 hypothetical protein [Bradyrhizobium sp. 30]